MTKNINIVFYIPQTINLAGIAEMVTKNKELLEQTKQDIIGMDLDYTHYLKIINTLKKEEKSTKDLVERLKNKEQEDIEVILKDWASNLRIFRLQMEKEQESWKDLFLKKAEEEIKNKIKEIVIDVAEQTNHKLKFDYSSFINERVAINLGMFKGVRVEQYQEQLTSILNDMSYEHGYNQIKDYG
jgi:ABC-type oligopeptide transport system ATPase subunit